MLMFVVVFIHDDGWERARWPSAGDWINKMWCIHTLEYCSALKRKGILKRRATWMNLEDMVPGAKGQRLCDSTPRSYLGKFIKTRS